MLRDNTSPGLTLVTGRFVSAADLGFRNITATTTQEYKQDLLDVDVTRDGA